MKDSIIKLRIANDTPIEGTVPVTVLNQSWPIFVFPEVYIDVEHILNVEVIDSPSMPEGTAVNIHFNESGCTRLSALADDIHTSTALFIDNYPLLNVAVTEKLYSAEILVDNFQTVEQVEYFCQKVREQKNIQAKAASPLSDRTR